MNWIRADGFWKTGADNHHLGTPSNTNAKSKKEKKEVQKSGKISPMVSAEHPSCNFDDEHCSGSKQQSTAQPGAPVPRTGMIGRRRYPAEHKPCITRLSFRNLPAETLDLSAEFIS